ncbi:MAG: response regulator [Blastocatellia bacterium]
MNQNHGHILCVDDDPDTCEMVTVWLGYENIRVTAAYTAAAGMRLVQHESFDLYLLDYQLPDGSGIEICRQIRAVDLHTPIIFVTASARDHEMRAGLVAGANIYLTKPVDLEKLCLEVRRFISGRQMVC